MSNIDNGYILYRNNIKKFEEYKHISSGTTRVRIVTYTPVMKIPIKCNGMEEQILNKIIFEIAFNKILTDNSRVDTEHLKSSLINLIHDYDVIELFMKRLNNIVRNHKVHIEHIFLNYINEGYMFGGWIVSPTDIISNNNYDILLVRKV